MSIIEGEPLAAPASVSLEIGGKEITFETGKLAKQADGAVVIRSGDTMVLATAQGRTEAREGADFFPLTIDVEERMYAAGKIPGGFFKREGRPTERAILTARMIDRPIRPLWPKGYRNEVQCIATVLSADMITPHDILAINGISAALMISPMPFLGPIGAVRIGLIDGELAVNPSLPETEENDELDLIVVGTKDGLTMVEAGANQIPEARLLEALDLAQQEIVKLCEAQEELAAPGRQAEVARRRRHAGDQRPLRRGDRQPPASTACARAPRSSARSSSARPAGSRWSRPRRTSSARCRCACRWPRCSRRSAPTVVEGPVREQFENDLRALTDAEQDSKELKSAKQHLLYDRIIDGVHLPFPVGPDTAGDAVQGLADQALRQEGRRGDLQGPRPQEDRGREAPPRRPLRDGDPADQLRGRRQPAHARLRPVHARPDADHVAAHPRHRQGGPADRRPLAREGSPVHAPLQLPAVLGRGDGPHDRPAPPRHRPRRARAARARGRDPGRGGLPLHDPHRVRDARVERLVVDGLGLRLDAGADGCRRADQAAGLRHRHGPRQGGRRLRHPHRHPGRRGSPR